MNNTEIRNLIKKYRLYFYEVAEKVGITEYTLSRWMRKELSETQKQRVLTAVSELTGEQYADRK